MKENGSKILDKGVEPKYGQMAPCMRDTGAMEKPTDVVD